MLQVADTIPDSPAVDVLLPGDRVRSMNGTAIFDRETVTTIIESSGGSPIEMEFIRDEEPMLAMVTPRYEEDEERYVIGVYFLTNTYTNELVDLAPTAPLRLAGVHAGDRVTAIDGTIRKTVC